MEWNFTNLTTNIKYPMLYETDDIFMQVKLWCDGIELKFYTLFIGIILANCLFLYLYWYHKDFLLEELDNVLLFNICMSLLMLIMWWFTK